MTITEQVIEILKQNPEATYVYVAKDNKHLDAIKQAASEQCSLANLKVKMILVNPLGLGRINGEVDGVFYDEDATTSEFISTHITVKPTTFITPVNHDTGELNVKHG